MRFLRRGRADARRRENNPDFSLLVRACRSIGPVLRPGCIVVFESTVHPGATEEICGPELEKASGLRCGVDFKLGYSPERINPGDREHPLEKIVKIVSGQDEESLEIIAGVYEQIIDAGVHRASSIKVAEAAKVLENTQRDINIALMNEMSKICDRSASAPPRCWQRRAPSGTSSSSRPARSAATASAWIPTT